MFYSWICFKHFYNNLINAQDLTQLYVTINLKLFKLFVYVVEILDENMSQSYCSAFVCFQLTNWWNREKTRKVTSRVSY